MQEAIEDILEFVHELNFVQKNIVHPVIFEARRHVLITCIGISQFLIFAVIQGYANDMIVINAFFMQMLTEKIKQQERFAATADTRNNLDEPVMLVGNKAAQISRT